MEDHQIVELFWSRSEAAIAETDRKYGALCRQIAMNVLHSAEDAEECVSDAYLGVWNAIPPQRPAVFPAFLCRFARNLALKRYERANAAKRGGSHPLGGAGRNARLSAEHRRRGGRGLCRSVHQRFSARIQPRGQKRLSAPVLVL